MTTGTFCFWLADSASVCYVQCLKAPITEDDKPIHLLAVDWQEMSEVFHLCGEIFQTLKPLLLLGFTIQCILTFMLLMPCKVQSNARTDVWWPLFGSVLIGCQSASQQHVMRPDNGQWCYLYTSKLLFFTLFLDVFYRMCTNYFFTSLLDVFYRMCTLGHII